MTRSTVSALVASKRAVLIDLFHTLVSFSKQATPAYASTADVLGVDPERWTDQLFDMFPERMRGEMTDPYGIIRTLAHAIDPDVSEDAIRRAADYRRKRFREALLDILPETLATLDMLKASGKLLALVSNADVVEVEAWPDSPLAGRFDVAVFSCAVGMIKPEEGIYRYALDRLGVSVEDAVFVGDGSCNELEGAKRVGLVTIMTEEFIGDLVRNKPHAVEARRRFADHIVRSLSEIV